MTKIPSSVAALVVLFFILFASQPRGKRLHIHEQPGGQIFPLFGSEISDPFPIESSLAFVTSLTDFDAFSGHVFAVGVSSSSFPMAAGRAIHQLLRKRLQSHSSVRNVFPSFQSSLICPICFGFSFCFLGTTREFVSSHPRTTLESDIRP